MNQAKIKCRSLAEARAIMMNLGEKDYRIIIDGNIYWVVRRKENE